MGRHGRDIFTLQTRIWRCVVGSPSGSVGGVQSEKDLEVSGLEIWPLVLFN